MAGDASSTLEWLVIPLVLMALAGFFIKFSTRNRPKSPPIISSWIPWLGCALEFGKSPLRFIKKAQDLHGSVFTVHAAGQYMTYLMDRKHFDIFFNSSDVEFQKAIQKPIRHAASISEKDVYKFHQSTHDLVKGRLASSNLGKLSPRVCQFLDRSLRRKEKTIKKQEDLMCLVRDVIFSTVVPGLFGAKALPSFDSDIKILSETFVKFDADFEYGAQLPEFLLKDWSKSKWFLMKQLRQLVHKITQEKTKEGTLLEAIVKNTAPNCAPNFGLMMLWASLANAVPITFWTMACILNDEKVKEAVKKEIQEVLGPVVKEKGFLADIGSNDLKKLQLIENCILEAIRLYSPGIIARYVAKPITVDGHTIPIGHLLLISPYWAHHDEAIFPNADMYIPSRWNEKSLMDKFIAFGGGRFQCPGRSFAMMEIKLFVSSLFYYFNMELAQESVPMPSTKHIIGVPQPGSECFIKIEKTSEWENLNTTA